FISSPLTVKTATVNQNWAALGIPAIKCRLVLVKGVSFYLA
ncbi:hypothetical protein ABIE64_002856, partial [Thalassospira sp. MBR-102]